MKRSSNLSLIVMGTLAFSASFAGGSAFLAWQQPNPAPACTTGPDGRQNCPPARSSGGSGRFWHFSLFSSDRSGAPPAGSAVGLTSAPSSRPSTTGVAASERAGFGASGRSFAARGGAGG